MRPFLRFLFPKRNPNQAPKQAHPRFSPLQARAMSTSSTSALLYAATISPPSATSTRPDDELTKSKAWHVPSGGFDNPWPSWRNFTPLSIMKAMVGRRFSGKGNTPDTTPPTVPVQKPTFLSSRTGSSKIRTTWLGHACYYVEYPSGLRVLFDPVFEDRCSPFSFMGPKRYTPPPCAIKDIPIIDAVVISHSHYDHLSHPTVTEIAKLHPDAHFFAPLGNKKWFQACGISQCTELDWWEEVDFTMTPKLPSSSDPKSSQRTSRISCLPCQHISARTPFDKAVTLWASWAVTSNSSSVYFAGDTGYRSVPPSSEGHDDWGPEYASLPHCPAFAEVGQYRGPFDVGLIPIGAYSPRYIMSPMHASPRDSVEIFLDTKCKRALGMHWGTWVLTEEDVLEPPKLLKEALKLKGVDEQGVFDVCDIGESREF